MTAASAAINWKQRNNAVRMAAVMAKIRQQLKNCN